METNEICDIVSILKYLYATLQPLANSRNIKLIFSPVVREIKVCYPANKIVSGFTKLVSTLIEYMPDDNCIYFTTEIKKEDKSEFMSVKVRNTGINLKQVPAVTNNSNIPAKLYSHADKETVYEVCFPLLSSGTVGDVKRETTNVGPFNYINFVKGIKTHFSRLNDHIEMLAETKPKEAAFLISVNDCILKNLEDERFDANALSVAMLMSRAQLLRRLKSITGNSPAYYIKNLRLAKAKELLQTTDESISEVAYKTGFNTPSNFTKVFSEKYGITPSQFRRPKPNATNE